MTYARKSRRRKTKKKSEKVKLRCGVNRASCLFPTFPTVSGSYFAKKRRPYVQSGQRTKLPHANESARRTTSKPENHKPSMKGFACRLVVISELESADQVESCPREATVTSEKWPFGTERRVNRPVLCSPSQYQPFSTT